jgi:5-(carboxyamino)imidazole ribonucleotide mutase
VLGVPVQSKALNGMDSLLSIAQMPRGVAVGTLAIGQSGAFNAGLLACQILATEDADLAQKVERFRAKQTQRILADPDPRS